MRRLGIWNCHNDGVWTRLGKMVMVKPVQVDEYTANSWRYAL